MMPTMSATINFNENFIDSEHTSILNSNSLFNNTMTRVKSIDYFDLFNIPFGICSTFSVIVENKPNYETLFDLSLMRESNQEELDFLYSIKKNSMKKLTFKK